MLKATLIVNQPGQATQEVLSGESVTSIGSALDNTVCLEDDPDVARYHAVIERRGDDFWLSDLGTQQGTKVNDEKLVLERELKDGDRITLGGACLIEFYRYDPAARSPETAVHSSSSSPHAASQAGSELSYAATSATGSAISTASSSLSSRAASGAGVHSVAGSPASLGAAGTAEGMSSSSKIIGASALGALALTGVAAVWLFNPFGGGCRPSARILTPISGATLRSAATIRVEASETQCIKRISYHLDGEEVASASVAPYEATLDPRRLSRFAAGNHVLTALVETTDGAEVRQPGEVYVALGAVDNKPGVAAAPPAAAQGDALLAGGTTQPAPLVAADVQAMAERLASQISGKSGYVFEREMTARIQTRTSEFASPDATERAARHRRTIVKAFSDRGVEVLLGFVLAMSRSRFDEAGAEGSGIWRTPPAIARSYAQAGETTASLDSPQRAAEVAATYLKDLLGIFEPESFDLVVACYGCTLEEAGALKQRLAAVPAAERRNFWRMAERGLVTEEQAERVVRFYAAGIVGENPQRFGGASDRRLSSLE